MYMLEIFTCWKYVQVGNMPMSEIWYAYALIGNKGVGNMTVGNMVIGKKLILATSGIITNQ